MIRNRNFKCRVYFVLLNFICNSDIGTNDLTSTKGDNNPLSKHSLTNTDENHASRSLSQHQPPNTSCGQ